MTCRQLGGSQTSSQLEHCVEANRAVAAHARVRRLACGVARNPWLYYSRAEGFAQIERQVREAESMG
ncbi:unannotated protein [freshwater metagenome]|uniref:Unannotated protein n=1 Tax=freshwater metagenome TaxID=449393 RepID=A0A6J7RUJ8_9ZZZZ